MAMFTCRTIFSFDYLATCITFTGVSPSLLFIGVTPKFSYSNKPNSIYCLHCTQPKKPLPQSITGTWLTIQQALRPCGTPVLQRLRRHTLFQTIFQLLAQQRVIRISISTIRSATHSGKIRPQTHLPRPPRAQQAAPFCPAISPSTRKEN